MICVVFFVLVLTFSANAYVSCENLDNYQDEISSFSKQDQINLVGASAVLDLSNQCFQSTGSDDVFKLHQVEFDYEGFCGKKSDSKNGFVKIVTECDFCKGLNIQNELVFHESFCNAQCLQKNKHCRMASNLWGGEIVKINPNGGECGSPLPGCAESSSSVGEDEQSSSSETPVSSEAESSSSEEEELESSSSGEIDSSSSEDEDYSSSSENDEILSSSSSLNGLYGYLEDLEPCPNDDFMRIEGINNSVLYESYLWTESKKLKLPRYTLKPGIFGEIKIDTYCFPMDEGGKDRFGVITNIPYVHFINSPYAFCSDWYGGGSMDNVVNIQSFYVCKGVAYQEYYSRNVVQDIQGCRMLREKEGVGFGIEITENMAKYDTDLQVSDTGLEYDADLFPSNFSLQQLVNDSRVVKGFEYCKERVRQMRGYKLSSSSYRRSSSSSEEKSSSSQAESSSSEKEEMASSSSTQINLSSSKIIKVSSSSMDEESSSSMEIEIVSSSAKKESSSSALVETSSSSRQAVSSSSDFVYSSSDDGVFVAGGDREYTPDQIFKDGLDNMEDGKCYSLNPARGMQRGWINTNAQDSWWWREVDCETGNKVDNNRVGSCPGFPLDNVPSSPKNACFAYNGTCYKCNPARGSECSNSWLWQGSFTSSNVGWWYEQVDCYDPFGDDFDGLCPDKFYLEKSEADNHDYLEIKNYTIEYSVSQKDFDALGRRLNGKRPKFLRSFNKRENKIVPTSKNTFDVGNIIYLPIEEIGLSHNFLAKQGDQCHDYSCGKLGIDYGIGNDVGVYCGYPCTELNMENGFLRIEVTKKRQTGSCGKNNPKYTITFKLPATATIKRKNIYYVAPIGYKMGDRVVTKDDYEAVERHEKGHMKSYSCLEDKKMFKSEYEFELEGVCEKEFTCNKNGVIKGLAQKIKDSVTVQKGTGIDALIKYNKNLWQKMCGWYHKNFSRYDGPGGPNNPKDIVCPTTATLLDTNYVLTGCEVFE